MGTVISVGTDGSPAAQRAVDWAGAEAHRAGGELRVIHVAEVPIEGYGLDLAPRELEVGAMLKAAHALVADTADRLRLLYPELLVVGVCERGEVGPVLIRNSNDADLLVIGAHERHLLADLAFGSNSRYVLHHATTNVAVIPANLPPGDERVIRQITVGVDGSEPSVAALIWAADESNRWGAVLKAVHTWDYRYLDQGAPINPSINFQQAAEDALAKAVEDCYAARPDLRDVLIDTSVICGSVSAVLLDAAKGSDMLVVGHKSRSTLGSILLGSVAFHAAQHASVPVVVVRRAKV